MNILQVSTATSWRGGEQQIAYLVKELLTMANIQVWVLCTKGSAMEKHCQQQGWRFFSFPKFFSFNLSFSYRLTQICERYKIDVVHAHDAHAHNFSVLANDVFRNNRPILLSRRVDFPVRNNKYSLYKYNHPSIKKIACVSKAIQTIMQVSVKDKDKLTTIHSGIDLKKWRKEKKTPKTAVLRQQYNLSSDELIIGNVAALAPHKDYFTFVKTADLLLKAGVNARFLLIGEGGERKKIEQYIERKGLAKKCILTGFRNDLVDVLPELDIFLMTSTTEGLGTSLLDACAAKVPIVATRAGGIPEVVIHEETGLLALPKDAENLKKQVIKIINNDFLRTKLIKNALHHVENFSTKKMAEKTLLLYQTICK